MDRHVLLDSERQSREGMIQANQAHVKSIILPAEREKESIDNPHAVLPSVTAPIRPPARGKRI